MDGRDRARRLAAAWFDAVGKIGQDGKVIESWRFCCPFCKATREDEHYTETYIAAYRHLEMCEWTDRAGLGPERFTAF